MLCFRIMGNLPKFKHLKLAHQRIMLGVLRKLSSDFYVDEHFPNIDNLRTKYIYLKMVEDSFKNFVCNELLEECNIEESSLYLHGFEKKYIITMDIEVLKKHNLLKSGTSQMSLVEGMLDYLEPFPFDSKQISSVKSQSHYCLSIKFLRDSIEKQYLAWKYNVDVQQITSILLRFQSSLFVGRSMRTLRRNSSILDMVSSFRNESLSKKIYLINQLPFNIPLVFKFTKSLPYLNWDLFSSYGYKILQCSFSHIYFFIQILQKKKFTSKQIQESVPFLYLNIDNFINRMNLILSHPALSEFQKHDKFFHLLLYPRVYLMNLNKQLNFHSLEELKDHIDLIHRKIKLRSRARRVTVASIKYHASSYFALDKEHLKIIKRHPKYSVVTEEQLSSTLRFLMTSGFSRTEILESIIIILYPRLSIAKAMKKIFKAKSLKKLGFVNGCVPIETNFFSGGTKSRRKTLQLCIYYIEKQFNFSWDGVLDISLMESDKEDKY